jgi:hypothetical protein
MTWVTIVPNEEIITPYDDIAAMGFAFEGDHHPVIFLPVKGVVFLSGQSHAKTRTAGRQVIQYIQVNLTRKVTLLDLAQLSGRKVVYATHNEGSGAFAVLFRLARALLHVANKKGYELHIYFLNSSVAADG